VAGAPEGDVSEHDDVKSSRERPGTPVGKGMRHRDRERCVGRGKIENNEEARNFCGGRSIISICSKCNKSRVQPVVNFVLEKNCFALKSLF
jgi:hypothetical protein